MNNNNSDRARANDSYQPKAEKTYSPLFINGNYQPVMPISANQKAMPPVGDSGLPAARNNVPHPGASNNNNTSSDTK